jgi:hypothetical protein
MESVLKDDIVAHLNKNKVIRPSQHCFKAGRSCTTNLLEFFEPVTKAADKGEPIDIVYLDFAKAFDKVPHQRLSAKIKAAGICGSMLAWIKDWLTNRSQRTVVNGKYSNWSRELLGVPQGSVLGPILFNIYINDLDSTVTASQLLKKFADDTKLGQILSNPACVEELQNTLNKLYTWSVDWGMQFNVAKCHVMHIGKNNPQQQLSASKAERDVGVIISD